MTEIQIYSQPWLTWLSECTIVKAKTDVALLAVPEQLAFLSTSLEFVSKAFGIAKKLYPTLTSIIIVTGTEYELITSGDISLHNVEALRNMND